jgi:hypothetical protein
MAEKIEKPNHSLADYQGRLAEFRDKLLWVRDYL